MGMRMSDRMAQFGGVMADYGDRFFESDQLRKELEKQRLQEEARTKAVGATLPMLNQMQYYKEPPTRQELAGAISPLAQYSAQYGDQKAMSGVSPMLDLLMGDMEAEEAFKRALARNQSQEKIAGMRLDADKKKELEKKTKDLRAYNKDLTARHVPGVGLALTVADAKDLKGATEKKKEFDRSIQEMIQLRKDKGFTVLDRGAIERGKQLSQKLLLLYKDLAKLGVLSQSDEKILKQIIPEDPLAFKFQGTGEDPILTRLTKFKADTNSDYETKLGLRLSRRYKPGEEVGEVSLEDLEAGKEFNIRESEAYKKRMAKIDELSNSAEKFSKEVKADKLDSWLRSDTVQKELQKMKVKFVKENDRQPRDEEVAYIVRKKYLQENME